MDVQSDRGVDPPLHMRRTQGSARSGWVIGAVAVKQVNEIKVLRTDTAAVVDSLVAGRAAERVLPGCRRRTSHVVGACTRPGR